MLTPAEMAAADAATIAAGVPEGELVERAGGAVARAARRLLGGTYGRRVVVVAGKGNNGADGIVAASALDGWGARVDVLRLVDGIDPDRLGRALGRADLAIDAMFGTGFRGPLEGEAASVASAL
ncbi:MAG: NAD(P)H-hydrate epimerase, partial [Acidimicrobiales bacterium]